MNAPLPRYLFNRPLGEPVRDISDTFSAVKLLDETFFNRKPPNVQTCTAPPERKRFVYYQHRVAAQALLADMLGDVPPLIPVHEAAQLRGLDAREPGTWVEVTHHPHLVPLTIWNAVVDAGLLVLTVCDTYRRNKATRDITRAVRETAKVLPPRPVSPWSRDMRS